jgi:CDP-diacylglycerol--serine O-phosphatidyltransferase
MRRRGIFIYALPNVFTSANLVFGFLAIVYAVDGKYESAAWALILSSIFDLLDGRVARLTHTTTKFGVEFDSLCDLVSFGIAPAMLAYLASLKEFGRLGLVVAIIYALCGALRLARFNVLSSVLPKAYFQGLPIPAASATIATLFFFAKELDISLQKNPWVLILVFTIGILMVSTVRFPSFKDTHFRHRQAFGKVAGILLALVSLIIWLEIASFVILVGYILVSLGLDLLRAYRRKAIH